MKCPRCGAEMTLDEHRKYGLYMCYECGYMEGRDLGEIKKKPTVFEHIKSLDADGLARLLSEHFDAKTAQVSEWLNEEA